MKLTFLYFSGTGNTDYVARYLADKLAGLPEEIRLLSVEQQPAETLDGFDLLAFGFPVYECDAPRFLRAYLQDLAPGEGRGAFVFCTKGAMAGNAVRHTMQLLAGRGYLPLLGASVTMPGSDGLAYMPKGSWMARSALKKDFDHLKAADRLAAEMAGVLKGLQAGKQVVELARPLPVSATGVILKPFWAYAYQLFAEPMRTRFWADERCSGCGLCASICPSDNIEMDGDHPCFSDRCVLCLRCIHNCPDEAIQIGKGTIDKFRWRGPKGEFHPLRLRPKEQGEK